MTLKESEREFGSLCKRRGANTSTSVSWKPWAQRPWGHSSLLQAKSLIIPAAWIPRIVWFVLRPTWWWKTSKNLGFITVSLRRSLGSLYKSSALQPMATPTSPWSSIVACERLGAGMWLCWHLNIFRRIWFSCVDTTSGSEAAIL